MRMGRRRRRGACRAGLSRPRRRPGAGRSSPGIDGRAHRKEGLGVDVALLVGRDADAQVDVRLGPGGLTARAHGGDGRPLRDRVALANPNRAEMLQRHGVAVGRPDRERLAAFRHGACEGHRSGRRREHVGSEIAGDVDAAMLTARIGIASEDERAEDPPTDRPCPGLSGGRHETGHDECEQDDTAHTQLLVCDLDNSRRPRYREHRMLCPERLDSGGLARSETPRRSSRSGSGKTAAPAAAEHESRRAAPCSRRRTCREAWTAPSR